MHTALIDGRKYWDNERGISRTIADSNEWQGEHTIQELRKMVRDRSKAAWIGLFATVVVQALTLAFWVGNIAMQVNNNTKKLDEFGADQKAQVPIVYSMPAIKESVNEIKSDVKELKTLLLERNFKNQKGG